MYAHYRHIGFQCRSLLSGYKWILKRSYLYHIFGQFVLPCVALCQGITYYFIWYHHLIDGEILLWLLKG